MSCLYLLSAMDCIHCIWQDTMFNISEGQRDPLSGLKKYIRSKCYYYYISVIYIISFSKSTFSAHLNIDDIHDQQDTHEILLGLLCKM